MILTPYFLVSTEVRVLEEECVKAKRELDDSKYSHEEAVKSAVKKTRLEERSHYAKIIDGHKSKTAILSTAVGDLTSHTVSAELQAKRSKAQVNRSSRRSDDVMEINNALEDKIKQLEQTIKEQQYERIAIEEVLDEKDDKIRALEKELNAKNDTIKALEETSPIKYFGKVRQGRRGATSWPHYVWESTTMLWSCSRYSRICSWTRKN
jgi:chromosome segregation ATPase